jgi:hypothetical protein
MTTRLLARIGQPYLSPPVVKERLGSAFAYIESSEELGRSYVLEMIRQVRKIDDTRRIPVESKYLDRLSKDRCGALYLHFGDDPGSETMLLGMYVIPGEPLVFDYSSQAHEQSTLPLLRRCAAVLGYDISKG